jgi:mannonate dehydratase
VRELWRWFGPHDKVSLDDIRQAGAVGVVSALHHIPAGVAWSEADISKRKQEVCRKVDGIQSGLAWEVVESLPVSEDIKTQTGEWRAHVDAYAQSIRALAQQGITNICYNFMPVLDWTRTDLRAKMRHGGTAMRFDLVDFAIFDLFILRRDGAEIAHSDQVREAAHRRFAAMDDSTSSRLARNIVAGLPGAVETWTLEELRDRLASYANLNATHLRQNLIDFLSQIAPLAEDLGVRLSCHPDDPPFSLLGLPRVMSVASDYHHVLAQVDSPAIGMTFCTGSFGVHPENDCVEIARDFGPRINFAHLRNVRRESETVPCSFFEDGHLEGQTDMVGVVGALLDEEARRRAEGRPDAVIPMRPDHGQSILTDLGIDTQPGYPPVGRLKGLAELRGIAAALSAIRNEGPAR